MTPLEELRAAMFRYDDPANLASRARLRADALAAARRLVGEGLPDPEVPEGKVLVDAEALRVVDAWLGRTADIGIVDPGRPDAATTTALTRLVADLPVPEWEPSDDAARAYCVAYEWPPTDVNIQQAAQDLRAAHAAGLLRDDL